MQLFKIVIYLEELTDDEQIIDEHLSIEEGIEK